MRTTDNTPIVESRVTMAYGNKVAQPTIPETLMTQFTMNERVNIEKMYFDNVPYAQLRVRTQQTLELFTQRAKEKKDDQLLLKTWERFPIKDNEIAVFDSFSFLHETMCLEGGAKNCTIYSYDTMSLAHPKLVFKLFHDHSTTQYDTVIAINALEHYGLGLYDTIINADADIQAMQKAKSILKSGGMMYLSIPVGKDKIVWNAHRIYGNIRLPYLLDGWKLLAIYVPEDVNTADEFNKLLEKDTGNKASVHPIFVLQKP